MEDGRQRRITRCLSLAIAVLLSLLVCLTTANAAFAWLTDSLGVVDDFTLSEFEEPAFAAMYSDDVLVFGRGEPEAEYDGRTLSAVYRGMESGDEDFAPAMVGSWTASPMNTSSVAPWDAYKGRLARVVSLTDGKIRPINMQNWFGEGSRAHMLTDVDLSCIDTSRCANTALMFNGCQSLRRVDVSQWNMGNCLTIANMFYNCKSLVELDVSGWSVGKLGNADGTGFHQSTYGAFSYCENLEVIDTSKWRIDFADAYTSLQLFTGCKSLKVMDVGGFKVIGTRTYGQGFKINGELGGCTSLEKMVISPSLPVRYNQYAGCPFPTPASDRNGVQNTNYWYVEGNDSPMTAWDVYYYQNDMLDRFANGLMADTPITYVASHDYSDGDAWASLYGESLLVFGRGAAQDIPGTYYGMELSAVYREIESAGFVRPWPNSIRKVCFSSPIYPMTCAEWFKGLAALTELEDSFNLHMGNTTTLSSMFQDCSSLEYIVADCWDTSSVTDVSYMFQGCGSLRFAALETLDFGNVVTLRQMFALCPLLEEVALPGNIGSTPLDTAYGMFQVFYNCTSLTRVDLSGVTTPDWKNNTATQSIFSGCESLEEVVIPCTFKFSMGTGLMDSRFNGFPYATNEASVKTMWKAEGLGRYEYAAANNKSNEFFGGVESPKVWIRVSVNTEAFAALYGEGTGDKILLFGREDAPYEYEGLPQLAVFEGIESYPSNRPWSAYSQEIVRVEFAFPDDLPRFAPKYMNRWFKDMKAKYLDVGAIDTQYVKDMSELFSGSYNLESIYGLETWNMASVTNTASMFACENLENAEGIQAWTCFYSEDTSWMFWGCNITSLDLSNWPCSPTSVASMFYQCSFLEEVELPHGLMDKTASAASMFWSCTSLKKLDLSVLRSGWTSWCVDLSDMFNRCSSLETIGDVSGWNMSNVRNIDGMFFACSKLEADCSSWDVSGLDRYDPSFNQGAPGVIAPVRAEPASEDVQADAASGSDSVSGLAEPASDGCGSEFTEPGWGEDASSEDDVSDGADVNDAYCLDVPDSGLENAEPSLQQVSASLKHVQINRTVRLVKPNAMPLIQI